MLRLNFGLLVAALFLGSCNTVRGAEAAPPPPPPPPPPAPAPASTPIPQPPSTTRHAGRPGILGGLIGGLGAVGGITYVPVGRVIDQSASFVPAGGGYAIILIKRGSPMRNARACAMMVQSLTMRSGIATDRPELIDGAMVYRRPVYWPVTVSSTLHCSSMLQNYDYERAMVNLQRVPGWTRLGQGPFVVVRKQNGNQAGFFDFSSVAAADFTDQFAAVVNYMSQRSDVWNPALYQHATFRQTMRLYVLERSGGAPLVLASLIDLGSG